MKLRRTQQTIFRVIWGGGKVIFSEKTLCLVFSLVTGQNKSPNQQPSQNRFLCVQKSNYNYYFSFQKEFYIEF